MKRALALVSLLALAGCASPADWAGDWRRLLARAAPAPELRQEPPATLPPPEGLRARSGSFRSVRLEWDPLLAGDVAGYAVERAPSRNGPFTRVAVVRGRFETVHVDRGPAGEDGEEGLGDGQTVFYRVRAFTSSGRLAAGASEATSATTAPLPAPPRDLRAYSLQPRQVPLSWSASRDPAVVGYVVERGPSSQGPFEEIARLDGRHETVYVDEALGDLRVLHYRVRTVNAAGAVGEATASVRAVTKPEPLPPYRLRAADQRLGVNQLAWEPNVEPDLAGYRLLRRREGSDEAELVATLPPHDTRTSDAAVGADELVSYSAVAFDREGLESRPTAPVVLRSPGYQLSATARPEWVELRWNPRHEEGWKHARILRTRRGTTRDLGVVESGRFIDSQVVPGSRYRYQLVLEAEDTRQAPPSTPLTVVVPDS